ncbi:MAG: hypothetical protein ABW321_12765 [Polyangiales bacterium]
MPNCVRTTRLVVLCVLASWLAACGGDECTRGSTECVSDQLIRTCVPTEDGPQWLVAQCSGNETCLSEPAHAILRGFPTSDDDAGVDPPNPDLVPRQPACVGNCDVGANECVSSALARYCVSGGVWQLDPCDIGERCSRGVCSLSSDGNTVKACEPEEKACASSAVAKICDADGSGWIEQRCVEGQTCIQGECRPDPESSCDTGDSCLDRNTAIRCKGPGQGYELIACDDETYCESGRCRGSVCAVGSSCIGSNQIRSCVAGESFEDTQCATNEICQEAGGDAECVALQCTAGTTLCGDPRDERVDAQRYFTTCVNGLGSEVPRWVRGECSGAASCDPMRAEGGNPCTRECTPGAQRCASDPLAGVNDGIEECQDDATWGRIRSCNTGADSQLLCAMAVDPDASQLPRAVCAAPICQWVFGNPLVGATGACEAELLLRCNPDGTLGDPEPCADGLCTTLRSTVTADGRMPGACSRSTSECKAGEQICIDASGSVTPRFRACVDGRWGPELMNCDDDAPCHTVKDDQGLRRALCGAQCSPGARRCTDNGELEECDARGQFAEGRLCTTGVCRETGNNDAACVLECVPGSRSCAGAITIAPDGYHDGTAQEIVCGQDGRRGEPQACADGTLCRVTGAGIVLGCVECIGPAASGGNAEGTSDSRCDPDSTNALQDCSDDNTWAEPRTCSGTKVCVDPTLGTCGSCAGATGTMVTCSESALQANDESASCESLGYGEPSAWGGLSDCCADYQQGDPSSVAYCR